MKRVLSFLLLVALLLTPVSVAAVGYGGIGGRPAHPRPDNPRTKSIFVYRLKAGKSAHDGVAIFNNTDSKRTITVDAVDAELASGGAFSCAQSSEPKNGVGSWIDLAKTQVEVPAHSHKTVSFIVTVPERAGVGEHDGCITIQDKSQSAKSSGQNGVVLGFRSAIRVAITVPGKLIKTLTIQAVHLSESKNGGYIVTPVVYNGGNVSLDTKVTGQLSPVLGASSPATSGTYPILPHSTASWNLAVDRPFWGGFYRATATIAYNKSTSTELGQGGGQDQTTQTLSSGVLFVWPAPAAIAIELVVLLIIITLIAWLLRRWLLQRHVDRDWQDYKVKKSDTLKKVADKHDIAWQKLVKHNKIKPPYHLEAGEVIKVPPQVDHKD